MRLRLTDDVHGVMIDDDAVFLDVAANAYYCLPAIGSIMRLAGGDIDTTEAVLADSLCAAGLAERDGRTRREDEPAPPRRPPPPPRWTARALVAGRDGRFSRKHGQALFAGWWRAARPRAFRALLPPVGPPAMSPSPAMLDDIAVFRRMAPWLPFDGACLFRSGFLLGYLETLGHRVDWVFGVRTWPFRAHCWLQAGDVALDDEAERLIAYHPIMVR